MAQDGKGTEQYVTITHLGQRLLFDTKRIGAARFVQLREMCKARLLEMPTLAETLAFVHGAVIEKAGGEELRREVDEALQTIALFSNTVMYGSRSSGQYIIDQPNLSVILGKAYEQGRRIHPSGMARFVRDLLGTDDRELVRKVEELGREYKQLSILPIHADSHELNVGAVVSNKRRDELELDFKYYPANPIDPAEPAESGNPKLVSGCTWGYRKAA